MTPTRQRIIDYLEKYQPSSILEIGRSLDLTPSDVFYHLQVLLKNGLIEPGSEEIRPIPRPGRPVKRYRLTRPDQPQNTALLTKLLFNLYVGQGKNAEEKQKLLKGLAENLVPGFIKEKPFHVRIAALVKELSSIHYAARWEAHQDGPLVIFTNCPYQAVVGDCPGLCDMDRLLLENCLDAPVSTLQTFRDQHEISRRCRFAILNAS
jgi:predicted ArsR family transcriptional regulator